MKKYFLQFDTIRDNALKLAYQIYNDGFIPNVILVSLRGGAYLGNVISEYLKIVNGKNCKIRYAAVVAHSFTGVGTANEVKIEGWTYMPDNLRTGDKVLLIDDIFDKGNTINHLAKIIIDNGIKRNDLKIAVHDYKYFYDKKEQLLFQPDYWCRKHELSIHDEDIWIHYMDHELVGLTNEEIEKHYTKRNPELEDAMKLLLK